jgi:hypothetical protein
MSLVLLALAVGLLAGALLGGRLRNLVGVRLRSVGLLLGGAVCESIGSRWGQGPVGLGLIIAGYVLLLTFAVRNVATTGMVLVAFGLLANVTVIALDRGMPVRGVAPSATFGPRHHGIRPQDRLVGLADVVRLAPFDEMVSAGDVVLSVGVATTVAGLMRPRRRARDTGPAPVAS